jgi:hypothetical protein
LSPSRADFSARIGYNVGVRKVLLILVATALSFGLTAASDTTLTVDEVARLLSAGIDEETLRELIETEEASFDLGARELLDLHQAGASSEFLRFLIRTHQKNEAEDGSDPESEAATDGTTTDPAPVQTDGKGNADRALPAGDDGDPAQRVYSKVRQDGRIVIVFTNLDDSGNPLPDDPNETSFIRVTSRDDTEYTVEGSTVTIPVTIPAESAGPLVQVVVNPPPPAPAPAPYPYAGAYPRYYGGFAGPTGFIDFPDKLPFLGYTLDNAYPKTVTGMGFPLFNDFTTKQPKKTPN